MAKTIKELADELGVSRQAIHQKIKKLSLTSELNKVDNKLTLSKKAENAIKKAFSHLAGQENVNNSSINLQLIDALNKQIDNQNEQIKELQNLLNNQQKLLDQQQQLQLNTQKQLEQLKIDYKEKKPKRKWLFKN